MLTKVKNALTMRLAAIPKRFDVPVEIGDAVLIDGDPEMRAVVTAICWRATMAEVEVSWTHNGDIKFMWMPPWRLADET